MYRYLDFFTFFVENSMILFKIYCVAQNCLINYAPVKILIVIISHNVRIVRINGCRFVYIHTY